MSQPDLKVYLALTTRPTETATWEDVTAYTESVPQIQRGRSDEFSRFEPGICRALMRNADRRFDPSYAAGPYYGNLRPMRRIKIEATWDGIVYPLFAGYLDGFPPEFSAGDGWAELSAQDGFKVLGRCELNSAMPQELSSDRVNRVLDLIGWTTGNCWVLDSLTNSQLGVSTILAPNGDRLVFPGQTTVMAETLEAANALQHLQDVTLTEMGRLFMAAGGEIIFQGRHYNLSPDRMAPRWTFGDDLSGDELPYVNAKFSYDDSRLWNEVRCTRVDGVTQTAIDLTSKADYFPIVLPQDRLLAVNDLEMTDRANWLLAHYKDPQWRLESLEIDPEGDDRLWPVALSAELGDRVRVRKRPFGGELMQFDGFIEQIQFRIAEGFRWSVTWQLSQADVAAGQYWQLTDGADAYAPYSVLDSTTILAY